MDKFRIVFAGTPAFASEHLQALLNSSHEVVAVYTQPDRPAGRGRKLTASPVKLLAKENGIPVYQPASLKNTEEQKILADLKPDVLVVVAYGLILPQAILDIPEQGCINVHGSLLPKWRGAAPIHRAIEAGDIQSGVTIMQLDAGLDTGDMLLKKSCAILPTDTSEQLHDRLIEIGRPALKETLDAIADKTIEPESQDERQACYARKMTRDEAFLDFSKTAWELDCQVRAFIPWPVTRIRIKDGAEKEEIVRIWQASALEQVYEAKPGTIVSITREGIDIVCGEGVLRITKIQRAGGKAVTISDFMNSNRQLFMVGQQVVLDQ
ncbi:Methionyl-tRNA formyltransferase [invertebrate metagenome]|uniref:methionyl-tRNA formyltransferase n=1 Tax=invertebrate metagenome TaxID=1711999 RepID=A0A2H9T855_9ZZZZ